MSVLQHTQLGNARNDNGPPTKPRAAMGYSVENTDSTRASYDHVKRVAIIGAGVAGLQLAERLGKKSGLEVAIYEKTNKVGGVWSANYADFGLQVCSAWDCLPHSSTADCTAPSAHRAASHPEPHSQRR